MPSNISTARRKNETMWQWMMRMERRKPCKIPNAPLTETNELLETLYINKTTKGV
jgi:hypothetical protein